MIKRITSPASADQLLSLNAGDMVELTGILLTGRDAAHKRMTEYMEKNIPLPFNLDKQSIYYTGPCPAPPGKTIGSCGPTTSSRMDSYTPQLLDLGLKIMIKGRQYKCKFHGSQWSCLSGSYRCWCINCPLYKEGRSIGL